MISKFRMVKVSKTTFAMVREGKVIYLFQNGQKTQDPLKIRYFQKMI